ncbi:interleukin-17 receptor B [Myripristis murdjan]|uniref:interleukin-17 receptor B n=1 Tax=Myripristis murdjan TaxID=586833 RepID=UPI001175D583|nr:interleukin-17 receptor B [Myripristis murdjan]
MNMFDHTKADIFTPLKILMMRGIILLVLCRVVAAQLTLQDIEVKCVENYDSPPTGQNATPAVLKDLKVELVTVGGSNMMNISWAVDVDVSISCLTGIRIRIQGEATYLCEYSPPLAKANLFKLEEVWFHYLVPAFSGINFIQAANLPLPPSGSGLSYKYVSLTVPEPYLPAEPRPTVKASTTEIPISGRTTPLPIDNGGQFTSSAVVIFGGLFGLMVLIGCFLIYKSWGTSLATLLGFSELPTSLGVPVSVLLVYPAETPAFQRAVVALAEFLQWHGGCSVAVDMWQQGKIAELGPLRWLAEQAKAAERVIIVSPQSSHCPPSLSIPGHSIPAAAHDLYPLVLNMVASHVRSPSELAKFWAVQLGEQGSGSLAVELRACKRFCLMKDLNKLCRSLHTKRQDSKRTPGLKLRPALTYSVKSTLTLRDAVWQLSRQQASGVTATETDPLKTVICV